MIFEYLGYILIATGIVFNIITLVGLIRIENVYNQLHIASVSDMFGVPLCLLGCIFVAIDFEMFSVVFKIIFLIITMYLLNPMNTYAIVKTAYFYNKK